MIILLTVLEKIVLLQLDKAFGPMNLRLIKLVYIQ